MKFVGVREFKQGLIRYLNEKDGVVVTRRNRPIARLVPLKGYTAERILLEIGRVLNEAGVSKKAALRMLESARKEIYGKDRH